MTKKDKEIMKDILEIKKRLETVGCEDILSKMMYCLEIPMVGFSKEYLIEEWYGVKIAKLISSAED